MANFVYSLIFYSSHLNNHETEAHYSQIMKFEFLASLAVSYLDRGDGVNIFAVLPSEAPYTDRFLSILKIP